MSGTWLSAARSLQSAPACTTSCNCYPHLLPQRLCIEQTSPNNLLGLPHPRNGHGHEAMCTTVWSWTGGRRMQQQGSYAAGSSVLLNATDFCLWTIPFCQQSMSTPVEYLGKHAARSASKLVLVQHPISSNDMRMVMRVIASGFCDHSSVHT